MLAIASLALLCVQSSAGAQSALTNPSPNREDLQRSVPSGQPTKQQTDLDTMQLASAHRERSETVQERTNGLWQSWLVSVCEGCGPKMKPYSETIRNDQERNVPTFTVGETSFDAARLASYRSLPSSEYSRRIYTDLTTENIDQIRRSPSR
ncbi:hypothetical protein [Methylobacterium durans]|nr:hypothetical protein [Methylobacterium durans]